MLSSMRALRSGALARSVVSTSPSRASLLSRGYATCSEEAPDFDPKILDRKVDLSLIEKGKGHYVNYKKLDENINIVRQR